MGDSLKWAAEQAEEAWHASDEYKKLKAQAVEWNDLVSKAMKLKVGDLTVSDLRFLVNLEVGVNVDYSRWRPNEDNFKRLRTLTASIVDKIAALDEPVPVTKPAQEPIHWFRGTHSGLSPITACGEPITAGVQISTVSHPRRPHVTCEQCALLGVGQPLA